MISIPRIGFSFLLGLTCLLLLTNIVLILSNKMHQSGIPEAASTSNSPSKHFKQENVEIAEKRNAIGDPPMSQEDNAKQRVKAAFVILCRNRDANSLERSMVSLQKRFNHRYNYPYIFLNDEPFTEEFINIVKGYAPEAEMSFGLIPMEHWSYPEWIDQGKAEESMKDMGRRMVKYGALPSYHHMCRFNSGFFYRHPLLKDLDWYWRVEPNVEFFCDINYDVFKFMEKEGKIYGFNIMMTEIQETIPTLWKTVLDFIRSKGDKNADKVPLNDGDDDGNKSIEPTTLSELDVLIREKSISMLLEDNLTDSTLNNKDIYNTCHFWSNFEIARLSFFHSPEYEEFFDFLDHAGGFFYERWGDAPIHTLALALFVSPDKLHYFEDIGYEHDTIQNCPSVTNPALLAGGACVCNPIRSIMKKNVNKCLAFYNKMQSEWNLRKVKMVKPEKKRSIPLGKSPNIRHGKIIRQPIS